MRILIADRTARACAILFAPAWAGVVGGELGKGGPGVSIWDKALHFSAYFILALLAGVALHDRVRAFLLALLGLVLMGGILEIIQGFIGRDCSLYDECANTLGVIAGGALAWAVSAVLVRLGRAH